MCNGSSQKAFGTGNPVQKCKQDRIEWVQHMSAGAEAHLAGAVSYYLGLEQFFWSRALLDGVAQNQAIFLGFFAPLWIGYVPTFRQVFWWDVYSEASCELDVSALSSGKHVICCFFVIAMGLAEDELLDIQRTHQHLWLTKVKYALLEEAGNFSIMWWASMTEQHMPPHRTRLV